MRCFMQDIKEQYIEIMSKCKKYIEEIKPLNQLEAKKFLVVKSLIEDSIKQGNRDNELFLMLANINAMLCDYKHAIEAMNDYLKSCPNDHKAINKLIKFKELNVKRKKSKLSLDDLERLKLYLEEQLREYTCKNNFHLTKKWLEDSNIRKVQTYLNWLRDEGIYCDCEVIMNL